MEHSEVDGEYRSRESNFAPYVRVFGSAPSYGSHGLVQTLSELVPLGHSSEIGKSLHKKFFKSVENRDLGFRNFGVRARATVVAAVLGFRVSASESYLSNAIFWEPRMA